MIFFTVQVLTTSLICMAPKNNHTFTKEIIFISIRNSNLTFYYIGLESGKLINNELCLKTIAKKFYFTRSGFLENLSLSDTYCT